jgi:hypothetical protein
MEVDGAALLRRSPTGSLRDGDSEERAEGVGGDASLAAGDLLHSIPSLGARGTSWTGSASPRERTIGRSSRCPNDGCSSRPAAGAVPCSQRVGEYSG